MAKGKRGGQLTNEETWRAVKDEGLKPAAVAAFEGVSTAAIYMRISHEKRRRSALEAQAIEAVTVEPSASGDPVAGFLAALQQLTARLATL